MVGTRTAVVAVALVVVGAVAGAGAVTVVDDGSTDRESSTDDPSPLVDVPSDAPTMGGFAAGNESVRQFGSESAYVQYVQRGRAMAADGRYLRRDVVFDDAVEVTAEADGAGDGGADRGMTVTPTPVATPTAVAESAATGGDGGDGGGASGEPDRVSGTNVQEAAIDEADILKTDGQHVYYAPGEMPRGRHGGGDAGFDTHVLSVEDPARPEELGDIETSGRMLLSGDRLVVLDEDEIVGYDVSDPEDPEEVWERPLESAIVTARLYDGQLYLVTQSRVSLAEPCPVEPLGEDGAVPCEDVYHPREQVPVDATYTAFRISPDDGAIADRASFVGTAERTAVYMSRNALYVTYTRAADRGELRIDFLLNEQADELPDWVESRLREIQGYNISGEAKRIEANRVLSQWYETLDDSEREVLQSNIRNDFRRFLTEHQRDLVRTGVVRVNVGEDSMGVDAVGAVPGRPLNQFSLDEHDGTLRITTTIPEIRGAESQNDLYTLDATSLERKGEVQNMGTNERVYSVRYVGDTAYVVTFRRIDPFHIVDLSDPTDPEEVGQLELPGFSSYLHPIDDDTVLGIGQEDGRVKAVTFDVSDPSDPTIEDDYILESGWSAVSESHHAFLLDREHGVFFLPTGAGGNVIDYTDEELDLEARVDVDGPALRAMYINDYMYVYGQEQVTVVDENTWEEVHTLDLD